MLLSCSFLVNTRNSHVCHLVEGVAADDNMKGRWCCWVGVKKDYYFCYKKRRQLLLGCHQLVDTGHCRSWSLRRDVPV